MIFLFEKYHKHAFFVLAAVFCSLCTELAFGQSDSTYWEKLTHKFENDPLYKYSFHGLVIYDLDSQKYHYEYNADKYFTPASNTKLITFYTTLKTLGDTFPSLKYMETGDSLIFWGTGDPTFLHPDFVGYDSVFHFLKNSDKRLFFSESNFEDAHFGTGWAWDDYNSSFSAEKSPFPIYGNVVKFEVGADCDVCAFPTFFTDKITEDEQIETGSLRISRDLHQNHFRYNARQKKYTQSKKVPFLANPNEIVKLLSDTLNKEVRLLNYAPPANLKSLSLYPTDSILRPMLQDSDNFLAEQLLIMSADKLLGTLDTDKLREFIHEHYLNDLTNPPRWVDGSGLSRYNLFTPRSFVELLLKIEKEIPQERIFALLPTGGKGTLKKRYLEHPSFLFAKTGTLSNNHNLSGFLVTQSGRRLVFSFMNNHYRVKVKKIADQMEEILTEIYLKF